MHIPLKTASDPRLEVMSKLNAPLYLYDPDSDHVMWANDAALDFWSAHSMAELCSRDFAVGMTQGVKTQIMQISELCHDKPIVAHRHWTVYPIGVPKTADFRMSAFTLDMSAQVLLIEVQHESHDDADEELYQITALMHTNTMISAFDDQYSLIYANPAAREEMLKDCDTLNSILHDTADMRMIVSALEHSDHNDLELKVKTRHGPRWFSVHLQRATNPKNGRQMFLVSASDATERRLAQHNAYQLAYTDSLTELPNRAAMVMYLEELLSTASSEPELRFGLFFLDLDRFKIINDSLGHATGDQLLIDTAERLKQTLGTNGTVYRLGGDEFVMVITHCAERSELKKLAQNILVATAKPVVVAEHNLRVLPSIGICCFPEDGDTIAQLLENADAAMYIAKSNQNGYCFHDRMISINISKTVEERLRLEHDLTVAVEQNEFELYFQPKIACRNLSVSGMEALIRWNHPTMGMVPPDKFIGIAEETGQIVNLGNWVLTAAMQQQKSWQAQGISIPVSVNISARQFGANDLLSNVSEALGLTDCNPHMIELEITESMLIGEPDAVHATLQQLSAMGIRLALDDFGTGYSNLAYLQKYPLDTLKIDKVFLAERKRSMLMGTILGMGKVLGLNVVAEGVETATQADWLIARGCDQMQGFYFSKPMPVTAATDYLMMNGALGVQPEDDKASTRNKAA